MLVTFVGCAGAGKNTIIKDLISAYPNDYDLLPTLTTRAMRPGESQGNPYYFVTKAEFERQIAEGMIYEYQPIHVDLYGGSRKVLADKLATGKTLLKDIDILGSATYKEKLSGECPVLSLFLYVEVEELLCRLRERGDEEENIGVRARRFEMEIALSGTSDYMINNLSREATGAIARGILQAEKNRRSYAISSACALPTREEVDDVVRSVQSGEALAPVEMGFNGKEILIVEGAQRYAAAAISGAFVQKRFSALPDETLTPAADQAMWTKMLSR